MSTNKIKILYVDDEENNLIAFRSNYRKKYDVYTAISAKEGLSILETTPVHLIISDQKMAHTTGVEFLEQTITLYPDSIRLLITGHTDIEVVIEAINRGQISNYIQKPWDWENLSLVIENCINTYNLKNELKQKNAALAKANDELNKFVYSLSHDLRSPLTSILGVVNITKLMPELKVAENYFEMIEGRVIKLDTFIKQVIDYYKNARGEDVRENVDFKSLIFDIWDNLKKPDEKPINFEFTIKQEDVFLGDLLRLEIIFENLIANAIKYQNPSSSSHLIKVSVEINNQAAKIIVSDNGIGIKKEYLESVFKLFFRTDSSSKTAGTGIGLYIVKESVTRLGGKIEVTSSLMQGTSFEILIPNKSLELISV